MADLNLDGKVDASDIGLIISLGDFGGPAPDGWIDGNLNGDGIVGTNDIGLIIGTGTFGNGTYGPKAAALQEAAPTLALPRSTGGGDKSAASAPAVQTTAATQVLPKPPPTPSFSTQSVRPLGDESEPMDSFFIGSHFATLYGAS